MTHKRTRYVAEIEMPEGIITIDCEVTRGDKYLIFLQLNQSTISFSDVGSSPLIEELVNSNGVTIEYGSKDVKGFLQDLLRNEFKGYSDISLTEVDTD